MSTHSNLENQDPNLKPSTPSHRSSTSLTPSSTHTDENRKATKTEQLHKLAHEFRIWLREPVNMFMFAMLLIVIVVGAGIFLLLVGWVKCRNEAQKVLWVEIFSQILNAIFTLGVVVPQPLRLRTVVRAVRLEWLSRKVAKIRKNEGRTLEEGGGDGTVARADEADTESKMGQIWSKVALDFPWMVGYAKEDRTKVVPQITAGRLVFLMSILNLHCLSQYVITTAMWGWPSTTRPPMMVFPMIPISFLASVIGGVLLGRDEAKVKRAEKTEIKATERKP